MSFLMGIVSRHWGKALMAGLIAVMALGIWWYRHEANHYRAQVATIRQAERDATAQAKAAQVAADKAEARNKALIAKETTIATEAASHARAEASKQLSGTQQRVRVIYRHRKTAKAWEQAPIPASVLKALKGGGL